MPRLARLSPQDDFWLYPGERVRRLAARCFKPTARTTGSTAPPKPTAPTLPRRLALRLARSAYAAHFHSVARLGRFDLYHEPNLVPFRLQMPTVVTVHDLSVILFPQWHPAERVKRYEQAFARGVETAAHILVDSDAVRSEAIRVLGLPPGASRRSTAGFRRPTARKLPRRSPQSANDWTSRRGIFYTWGLSSRART